MTAAGMRASLPVGESLLDRGISMFPDDLPLCGYCGLDEITHDRTEDHDFVAVGGGRTVPRHPDYCPRSKFRANSKTILLLSAALWAGVAWGIFDSVR